jgi:hypothetical protein
VSQDQLAIAIVVLGAWGLATAVMVLGSNPPTKLGRRWHAGHIRKVFDGGGVGRRASHESGALVVGCVRALGNATKL